MIVRIGLALLAVVTVATIALGLTLTRVHHNAHASGPLPPGPVILFPARWRHIDHLDRDSIDTTRHPAYRVGQYRSEYCDYPNASRVGCSHRYSQPDANV